jgi:hypothetical protein
MTDALKLVFIKSQLRTNSRLVIAFSDKDAAAHFVGKSWMARALAMFDIIVEVVDLPDELRTVLIRAQQRQVRNNRS